MKDWPKHLYKKLPKFVTQYDFYHEIPKSYNQALYKATNSDRYILVLHTGNYIEHETQTYLQESEVMAWEEIVKELTVDLKICKKLLECCKNGWEDD